ncbi:MAG: ATP-binding protein [Planctomycetes bacterium]|nr:ATP-binding protein [Planctomycetota bacterium]
MMKHRQLSRIIATFASILFVVLAAALVFAIVTNSGASASRTVSVVVAFGMIASFAAVVICGIVNSRRRKRSLRKLKSSIEAIRDGAQQTHVSTIEDDELMDLREAIDDARKVLTDRLEQLVADHAQVIAIIKSMVEGVVAIDKKGRVMLMNDPACEILGVRSRWDRSKKLGEITRVREIVEILESALGTGEAIEGEFTLPWSPRNRSIEMQASVLRGRIGEVIGAVVVLHEVSALRLAEEVRREFVANVSHELKTPLTVIRGIVETVVDDPEMPGDLRAKFMRKVITQTDRLSALVTDVLTLSKIEGDSQEPVDREIIDLRRGMKESIAYWVDRARDKGIDMRFDLPDVEVKVRADYELIREALDNLISNAIKYTPASGKVTITLQQSGGSAVMTVSDSGIGIAKDQQARVFERFYRVDKARSRELGGTGLGLSIVKHIAISLGGSIRLVSELGAGSSFIISLPIAA